MYAIQFPANYVLDLIFNQCVRLLITGDNMNLFLNENWRELLIELQPAIEDVFGAAFTEVGQQFLSRVPLNQLLLD